MPTKATDAAQQVVTLAIDTGGTGIKMMALDSNGKPLTERVRLPTPVPATTTAVLAEFEKIKAQMPAFDRVSVGFPGVIKHGKTFTAANLDPSWVGFPLQETLEKQWKKPVRVCNDAAVQGYAAVQGKGVELILTLGTGLGSALFTSGHLCPGLELAHHIWRKKDRDYEDYLGKRGFEKYGAERWNSLVQEAIEQTCQAIQLGHPVHRRRQCQEDHFQAAGECEDRLQRRWVARRGGAVERCMLAIASSNQV